MTAENFATANEYKSDPIYRVIVETETETAEYDTFLANMVDSDWNCQELPEDYRF